MSHNHGDTILFHPSSAQSDMDEIESLIHTAPSSATVLPPRASIPISSSPAPGPVPSKPPLPAASIPISVSPVPPAIASSSVSVSVPIGAEGFGPPPNTLTEPVRDTVKRDLARIEQPQARRLPKPLPQGPWQGAQGLGPVGTHSFFPAFDSRPHGPPPPTPPPPGSIRPVGSASVLPSSTSEVSATSRPRPPGPWSLSAPCCALPLLPWRRTLWSLVVMLKALLCRMPGYGTIVLKEIIIHQCLVALSFLCARIFFSRNSSSHGDCGLIPRGGQSTDLVARHKDEVRSNMAAMVRKVTSSSPTGSAAE